MAECILEDEKLVRDGSPLDRIPSNINFRTENRLKIVTNVNCKIRQKKLRAIRPSCEEQNMASIGFSQTPRQQRESGRLKIA